MVTIEASLSELKPFYFALCNKLIQEFKTIFMK